MSGLTERARQRAGFADSHLTHGSAQLQAISGDAGTRSYWRLPGHGVVMDAPPTLNNLQAWLHMRAVLEAGGVRVPRLLAQDTEQGFLLIEDLGDRNLLDVIRTDNADDYFGAAIEQLLRLQPIVPPRSPGRFDDHLLTRDLKLFEDWFVSRLLGLEVDDEALTAWRASCKLLIGQAQRQPQVLVHRDFMPRNLMPTGDSLAVIDFQDAVIGPIAYDPMSLFKDAFVSWPQERIEHWLQDYHRKALAARLPVPAWPVFRRDVDLLGVHRHLKILGIFARLSLRDHKPAYLDDAPRFIAYLDAVLPRYPELQALQRWLDYRVWPAWQARTGP